jgi:hypothetical protein
VRAHGWPPRRRTAARPGALLRLGGHPTSGLELSLELENLPHNRRPEFVLEGTSPRTEADRSACGKITWEFC